MPYLHGVGHVVVGRVVDAGEEVLTQLWGKEPGCSAPEQKDAPLRGTQATKISTFLPQKAEQQRWDSSWRGGRKAPGNVEGTGTRRASPCLVGTWAQSLAHTARPNLCPGAWVKLPVVSPDQQLVSPASPSLPATLFPCAPRSGQGEPVSRRYLWDDALLVLLLLPHHGVGFSSPCLPVGKDTDVIAFEGMLQHLLADVPVHLLLRCIIDVCRLWRGERGDQRRPSCCIPAPLRAPARLWLPAAYRGVGPVGIVKAEAFRCLFGLLRVQDGWGQREGCEGTRWYHCLLHPGQAATGLVPDRSPWAGNQDGVPPAPPWGPGRRAKALQNALVSVVQGSCSFPWAASCSITHPQQRRGDSPRHGGPSPPWGARVGQEQPRGLCLLLAPCFIFST